MEPVPTGEGMVSRKLWVDEPRVRQEADLSKNRPSHVSLTELLDVESHVRPARSSEGPKPQSPPRIALPSWAELSGSHGRPKRALLLNARSIEILAIKAFVDGS